jgi:hypothetical protein
MIDLTKVALGVAIAALGLGVYNTATKASKEKKDTAKPETK